MKTPPDADIVILSRPVPRRLDMALLALYFALRLYRGHVEVTLRNRQRYGDPGPWQLTPGSVTLFCNPRLQGRSWARLLWEAWRGR